MSDSVKTTKSERTRATILEAASQIFASNGYERTTIRDIASAASIDPAMVIRYFGSKDELFARIAVFDLRLPDPGTIEPSRLGEVLVRHFLDIWEGDEGNSGMAVLLRSAASNDFALQKLREVFAGQVMPVLARIEGPLNPGDRAALVATQLLGLAFSRYVIKLQPVVALPQDLIVRELGRTLQAYLKG
jgi:AcrR family transcriptional regulator